MTCGVQNQQTLKKVCGFCIERRQSIIEHGGTGVYITKGNVRKHSIVGIYPGKRADTNCVSVKAKPFIVYLFASTR